MKIRNHRDFWAGLMFIAIGLAFIVLARQYTVGTAAKMGPGYFPQALGILMAVLGLVVGAGGLGGKAAVLLKLGMVASLVLLIGVSAMASHEFRLRDTLISMVVLITLAWAVFVWGLELQFPVWPPFLANN
jgi:hypothetical protein